MRVKRIITNNKQIYHKLTNLHFNQNTILENIKPIQIQKIINKTNLKMKLLDDKKILIEKNGPVNYIMYLKNQSNFKL